MNMKSNRKGFTLLEILTAIAILGLLMGRLLPVFTHARRAGMRSDTLSNLRQIGLALAMYESDHDDRMPRTFEALQASGYSLPEELFLAKADPFREFGSMARDCFAGQTTVATSYDNNLDWPEHLKQELEEYDGNYGIIACRVYGNRTDYFRKAQTKFCAYRSFAFEGVLLRLRRDTSVQTAKLPLHWAVQPGSTKPSPMFSVFDLYTDGFPQKGSRE